MTGFQRVKSEAQPRHGDFESDLRTCATEYFRKRNFPVQPRHPYILKTRAEWPRNIILPEVAEYLKQEIAERKNQREGLSLHQYVHHGLSSQAMLFNLLGPLVIRNDYEPVRTVLRAKGIDWTASVKQARFEVENREIFNENYAQPTSIDLVIESERGTGLFIEAKLCERGFGGCSLFAKGDCDGRNPARQRDLCYLHRVGRTYWEKLAKHEIIPPTRVDSPRCPLTDCYQFFREVLFALEYNGTFVLLHDERNSTFCGDGQSDSYGVFSFLVSMLPDHVQSHITDISIQQLLEAISSTGRHNDWVAEFAEKYGLRISEGKSERQLNVISSRG